MYIHAHTYKSIHVWICSIYTYLSTHTYIIMDTIVYSTWMLNACKYIYISKYIHIYNHEYNRLQYLDAQRLQAYIHI